MKVLRKTNFSDFVSIINTKFSFYSTGMYVHVVTCALRILTLSTLKSWLLDGRFVSLTLARKCALLESVKTATHPQNYPNI